MTKLELRTGNVLLIDVIRYSPRTDDQQSQIIGILNRLVSETPTMIHTAEEERLCLPTGDGLATAFFRDPRSSIYFALELDERLRVHNSQASEDDQFGLRMGINQGLVYAIKDINQRDNLAGDGINRVTRVTDCGDSGHILISQDFADSLGRADSTLALLFHPLGEFEVKHGEKIAIASIYDVEHGNPEMPTRKPRVGGTLYDTAPALRIMLTVGRPLMGYRCESNREQLALVNPSAFLGGVSIHPIATPENCMEIEPLRRALQKAEAHVEISVLHGATPGGLVESLYERNIKILHFDGHGTQNGSLAFESPCGEAHLVTPSLLARITAEHGIKMVVLRASHAAECVDALRDAGIPAVVGMADSIMQDAAVAFVSRFYRGLARGRSLKEAFERGRLMVNLLFSADPGSADTFIFSAKDEEAPLVSLPHRGSPPIFKSFFTKPAMAPEPDTPFTGRKREMTQLIKKLADGGVVELHGEGGIGKTALAREVAQWHIARGKFPGGIFWIDLACGGSKESICDAVGFKIAGDGFHRLMPEEKYSFLASYLEEKPSLIVLDGFDTVAKDAELRRWLHTGIQPPCALLILTESDANIGTVEILRELIPSEAHTLFIEHARQKGWNGPADAKEEEIIADLCQLVGYMPLAIILVASKIAVFALRTLRTELESSMKTITHADNTFLPERHQIINACLNVSYKLLNSEGAKLLLKRLLLLVENTDDELIGAICGFDDWLSAVAELVRSSLLRKEGDFYRLHPLIRRYMTAKLGERDEEETSRQKAEDAQRYYLQTREIKEELGSKNRTATSLSRLSSLYENRGDFYTAVKLLTVAYDIFAATGSDNAEQIRRELDNFRNVIGEERFDYLIKNTRSHPDAIIREVLGESLRQPV